MICILLKPNKLFGLKSTKPVMYLPSTGKPQNPQQCTDLCVVTVKGSKTVIMFK